MSNAQRTSMTAHLHHVRMVPLVLIVSMVSNAYVDLALAVSDVTSTTMIASLGILIVKFLSILERILLME